MESEKLLRQRHHVTWGIIILGLLVASSLVYWFNRQITTSPSASNREELRRTLKQDLQRN